MCRDWRVGEGERWTQPFFSILLTNKFSKSFLYMLNQSYEIIMLTSLNHDCCTSVGPCMIYIFFGGGGGSGKGVSPDSRWTAGMKGNLSAGCRLPTPLWCSRKNRIVKNCNIYPTSQYVVVTYFSSLRPCIQSWLEIINKLHFKSDASDRHRLWNTLVYKKKDTLSSEVVSFTIYPAYKKNKIC